MSQIRIVLDRIPRWLAVLSVIGVAAANAAAQEPKRLALLVGCTKYDNLDPANNLDGPANDVKLFRQLLQQRFGFQNVVTLAEAEGKPELRPTRANIQREFAALAQKAGKADQVVILMGGHGTQQPNDNPDDPEDSEPDGLDEVFLPADVAAWSAELKTIVNAIKDDELREWIGNIRNKGASVWLIADCCHSGTISREIKAAGIDAERKRELKADLLVPKAVLDAALAAAPKTRGGGPVPTDNSSGIVENTRGGSAKTAPGEIVAMYAALSTEPTVERPLPDEAEPAERKPYGLLTFTLNQILTRASGPLTYRELTQRIQQQYAAWGRHFPTPLIEGTGTEREVLGTRQWPGRSRLTLGSADGTLKINAGTMQGLTKDCILAIFPPAGETAGAKPVGHVKVTRSSALDAEVAPCEYANQPAVKELPIGGRAEVVHIDTALRPLRIAAAAGSAAPPASLLAAMKSKIELPPEAIQFVATTQQADWVVQATNDGVLLIPAAGLVEASRSGAAAGETASVFGPYPPNDALAARLAENIGKIARVQHLLSLSEPADGGRIASGGVNVEVGLFRSNPQKGRDSVVPVDLSQGSFSLPPDEVLEFKLTNKGRVPADVTLLYIDENYGIVSWFPKAGTTTNNRIAAGATVGWPDVRRAELEPGTVGMQHMVLVATLGEGPPQDFTWLEQPSIQKVRDVTGASRGIESDLAQVFKHAVFGSGTARAMKAERAASHAIRTISWQFK